jgi:hypothetical protein
MKFSNQNKFFFIQLVEETEVANVPLQVAVVLVLSAGLAPPARRLVFLEQATRRFHFPEIVREIIGNALG